MHELMIAAAIRAVTELEQLPWATMDRNTINAYFGHIDDDDYSVPCKGARAA